MQLFDTVLATAALQFALPSAGFLRSLLSPKLLSLPRLYTALPAAQCSGLKRPA